MTMEESTDPNFTMLIDALKKLSSEMSESIIVAERAKNFPSFNHALLQKRIEDGYLKNFHKATEVQKEKLLRKSAGYFQFYKEIYDPVPEFKKIDEGDSNEEV